MKPLLASTLLTVTLCFLTAAIAAPVVAPGGFNPAQVNIQHSGGNTTITQTSQTTAIRWNKFNIYKGEKTEFRQPNRSAVAVNRVNSANGASEIYGSLKANGRIVLINQAGIYFAPGSFVNVGSLIASTSDMSRFNENKYVFDIPSPIPHAAVINRGTISAADYGLVALIGSRVENSGTITVHAGTVIMGTANKFTLDFVGDQLLNFSIDEAANDSTSAQDIKTLGQAHISPTVAQQVLNRAVNTRHIPEARHFAQAANGDLIFSSGKIDVSSKNPGERGGKVKLLAKRIKVNRAVIDASGDGGGGEVLIGGNYQGKGPEFNATTTSIDRASTINANAITHGNGGKVIVWANDHTSFDGVISAKGGTLSGDGGLVETSGKNTLAIGQYASVNTLATNGKTGTWLLDPTEINIINGPSGGSNLGVAALSNSLNTSDISLFADIIRFTDPTGAPIALSWGAANTLTLQASSIRINTNTTITGYNTVFDGPVYYLNESTRPRYPASLTVNGNATFTSSIGTLAGARYNPALASLTVTGNLTLGSNAISLYSNTIYGSTAPSPSNTLDISNTLSTNTPNPNSVFLTGNTAGIFDVYKTYENQFFLVLFSGFGNLIAPSNSTIQFPNISQNVISFQTNPPSSLANANNGIGFNYAQFTTFKPGSVVPNILVQSAPGVTLVEGPPLPGPIPSHIVTLGNAPNTVAITVIDEYFDPPSTPTPTTPGLIPGVSIVLPITLTLVNADPLAASFAQVKAASCSDTTNSLDCKNLNSEK